MTKLERALRALEEDIRRREIGGWPKGLEARLDKVRRVRREIDRERLGWGKALEGTIEIGMRRRRHKTAAELATLEARGRRQKGRR